jgi:hypothetical protein
MDRRWCYLLHLTAIADFMLHSPLHNLPAMMRMVLLSGTIIITSCASKQGYQAKSADEARAYAAHAVQAGVVPAGGEQDLFLQKSAGKPATGKWDPAKIERFVAKWVANNPKRAELNLAATKGTISENERLHLMAVLDMSEAAEQQRKAAAVQAVAAGLNSAAASMNQSAAAMNQSAALYRPRTYVAPTYQPPRTINLYPTYGGGYRGTIY